jgi:hypothetical protein
MMDSLIQIDNVATGAQFSLWKPYVEEGIRNGAMGR